MTRNKEYLKEIVNIKDKILEKNRKAFIDNFWLNLGDTSKITTTNVIGEHQLFRENPMLSVVDFMRRPENFWWTCKILFNIRLHPFQVVGLQTLWNHTFSIFIATRGGGKSFSLALYSLLLCLFKPGSKVILTGSSFRQAKVIFSYCETILKNSPMFQDILSHDKNNRPSHEQDMYKFRIDSSSIIALPTGDGSRIRGQRSTCLINDEFNATDLAVYEEVMQGFASVSMNPVERVIERARYKALLEMGDISAEQYNEIVSGGVANQQILSGTPGFTFENLHKYWKRYHDIIMSRGDEKKVRAIFNDDIPPGFNWKDYAIVRLPHDILPDGYMDEKTLGKAKATTNSGIFLSEFSACFLSDSAGFFRRTLIEKCVCGGSRVQKNGVNVEYCATLKGSSNYKYVIGIDPAAEKDNLAIVVIELRDGHRRIVYCWTINEKKHNEKLKRGLVEEHNYYVYVCRKIRDLMKVFKTEHIVCDSQGGGGSIKEVLGDPKCIKDGEYPIYPAIDKDNRQDTDYLPGLHILYLIHFANAQWIYDANHGLKQDFETQELLFPVKDSLAFGTARAEDMALNRILVSDDDPDYEDYCDTLEDCMLEIEELKNELTLIEHTKTPSGRDKWDTPTVKGIGAKKGKLKKDRYSALLIANGIGRTLITRLAQEDYVYGDLARNISHKSKDKHAGDEYGVAIQGGRFVR